VHAHPNDGEAGVGALPLLLLVDGSLASLPRNKQEAPKKPVAECEAPS